MRLFLSTPVSGHHTSIMSRFDRSLFQQLTPPGAQVDLVRFDGSTTGDTVHLRLKMPFMPAQDWISEIVEHGSTAQESWFVDQGTTLPWFLTYWRHRHVVKQSGDHSEIIDDIEFQGPTWLPDVLMYPILWAQFAWRKPIYRQIFGAVPSQKK